MAAMEKELAALVTAMADIHQLMSEIQVETKKEREINYQELRTWAKSNNSLLTMISSAINAIDALKQKIIELGGNIEKLWRGLKGGVAETEDYRTTDLLDRDAEIKSELGRNIKKLGQGLEGGVAKDHSIIDNESESINEDIRINQPASEPTRTAKNQHRGRQ
jgi:hypothetical protein